MKMRFQTLNLFSIIQIKTLEKNCKDFGIQLFDINSPNQGIVHVIGPQLGDYIAWFNNSLW